MKEGLGQGLQQLHEEHVDALRNSFATATDCRIRNANREIHKMTREYTRTREEVCLDLLAELRDTWSGATCTVSTKVESADGKEYIYNNILKEHEREPKHHDPLVDETRLAAAEPTGRDRELLEKLVRAALVAAASVKATVVSQASLSPSCQLCHLLTRHFLGLRRAD